MFGQYEYFIGFSQGGKGFVCGNAKKRGGWPGGGKNIS
jgi:hypothetical protein